MVVYAYSDGQRQPLTDPQAAIAGTLLPVKEISAYQGQSRSVVWSRSPVVLQASAPAWDTVTLTWSGPGAGVDSYKLYRANTLIYSGNLLTYSEDRRLPGVAYAYRIEAIRGGTVVSTAQASVTTPTRRDMGFTATAQAYNSIRLAWTDPDQRSVDGYEIRRTNPSTVIGTALPGSTKQYDFTTAQASTAYDFQLRALRSGLVIDTDTASATTPAIPLQQRVWSGTAVETASFTGSLSKRTDTNLCYYGYYSSNQGNQQSQARWDIPAEIRNCVSVDRVELRWYNQHTWDGAGTTVSMVGHHNTNLNAWGGCTNVLLDRGSQVHWPCPKGGWINNTDWYDLAWLTSANRYSIAEEIRIHGLQGFGLVASKGGQAGYGYASADPILRITYTVQV